MGSEPLPPSVNEIIAFLGEAATPSGRVRGREEDLVKADMMNVRQRWIAVDPRAFQVKCYEAGLASASVGALVSFLTRIQQGRRLRPRDKGFRFPQSPDTASAI